SRGGVGTRSTRLGQRIQTARYLRRRKRSAGLGSPPVERGRTRSGGATGPLPKRGRRLSVGRQSLRQQSAARRRVGRRLSVSRRTQTTEGGVGALSPQSRSPAFDRVAVSGVRTTALRLSRTG